MKKVHGVLSIKADDREYYAAITDSHSYNGEPSLFIYIATDKLLDKKPTEAMKESETMEYQEGGESANHDFLNFIENARSLSIKAQFEEDGDFEYLPITFDDAVEQGTMPYLQGIKVH